MQVAITATNETALSYVDATQVRVTNTPSLPSQPKPHSFAAAVQNPATPSKRRHSAAEPNSAGTSEESEVDDGLEMEVALGKKAKKSAAKLRRTTPGMPAPLAAPRPTSNSSDAARPPKIAPLLIQGLSNEQLQSYQIRLYAVLGVERELIARATMTKAGNIIVGPANEAASKKLLEATLPPNISIKILEKRIKRLASPHVVLRGVPLVLNADDIAEFTGFACRRLLSSANKGKPTLMVKITVPSEERKKEILENGLIVGHQRFRAVPYDGDTAVLMCYKCYAPGHIAKNCKKERQCRRCGGEHMAADCIAVVPKCSNCDQEHEATHPECPAIVAHKEERKARVLTAAAKTRQPADNVEALRLASCIASCFKSFAAKANLNIQQADIANFVAKSVREAYKVSLTGPHVKSLLLATAEATDSPQ